MYLRLLDKTFLKISPLEYLLSTFKDGFRDSIKINMTAFEILSLCNGSNSIYSIVKILAEKYCDNEKNIEKIVSEFLLPFIQAGLVKTIDKNIRIDNMVRGNKNIFLPDIIIWEITDYCPLGCKHCYLPSKNKNIFSHNDIEKVFDIINKSGVYQVQLTGGEPLLHPEIDYIIDFLINQGIIISISSSGMIFSNNLLACLKKLKKVNGSFVRISLDGNEDTHNFIRQNSSSYKNALNFIKVLNENKIPCQIGTTIVNQTKQELEKLTLIAKKYGVCLLEFGLLTVQGNAKKNQLNSFLKQNELTQFLKYLSTKYSDKNFMIKVPNEKKLLKNCGAGYKIIVVKANKNITICPTAEFSMGNLDLQLFEKIMKKSGINFNKIESPDKKVCSDCKNQAECEGCISKALILKNNVKKCYWYEKQSEFLGKFVN